MSFKPYPKYKESGVEWLGRVPEHWEVRRFQRCVDIAEGQVDPSDPTYAEMALIAPNHIESGTGRLYGIETAADQSAESGKYECRAGDVVYSKIRPSLRKVCIAPVDCLCSADMYPLRPHSGLIGGYLFWTILSEYFSAFAVLESDRVAMPKINRESLKQLSVPMPTTVEQIAISSFLDHETAKIGALIAEQQRLIELLQEKRQAVISHAVTKGLNPDAPMKDSRIEWLGEVPEHWEIVRIRHLVQQDRRVTYGIVQPGEPTPDGAFMVRGKDYSYGWCDPTEIFRVSSAIEVPYARSRICTGDLVMTIVGAGVGNVAVVPEWLNGSNITQTTARIALDSTRACPAYVCGALRGVIGRRNLDCFVYGSAQPRLNIEHVDSYAMTVPPIEEQKVIAAWVSQHGKVFDQLTDESKTSINLLQERRSALISAAVTGQIDVRGFNTGGSEAA